MKVLLVHDKDVASERPGGIAVYLRHLERGLCDRGFQTSTIRFTDDPCRPGELKAFRHRWRPSVAVAFGRLVEREDPDVVHLNGMPMLHPSLVGSLMQARPLVWMFHDVSPFCFWGTRLTRSRGALCDRRFGVGCVTSGCFRPTGLGDVARVLTHGRALRLYRAVPKFVVPSRFLADLLVDHGIGADRIEIVPLFSRYEARVREATPADDAARILFVGRLSREKGILALVRALATLRERAWTARVAGDGPLREAARRMTAQSDLESRVTWLGELDEASLAAEYEACTLLVVPSIAPESFGLVGVEAMSFGKPVVCFDAGGIVQWLTDDVNGLLASRGEVRELATQIARLLACPGLRDRLGRAGRERVEREFSFARHVDHIAAVYKSVIDGWSAGAG